MKNFKVFAVVIVLAIISSGMFNACQKETIVQKEAIVQKETVSMKQLKSTGFVIVTDEERKFLEDPISVDEFEKLGFIEQVRMQPGCFFVVHMNADGMLQKGVLSPNTPHKEWYDRLHEYYKIAQDSSTIDPKNPDTPPILYGCITVGSLDSVIKQTRILQEEGYDYTVCYDSKTKKYTICWNDK